MDGKDHNLSLIYEGKICPYCGADTIYVDSAAVYNKSYGMIYLCKPCDAYVGVHKGTTNAKGRLADSDLRYLKKQAHFYFDPIWQSELDKGEAKHIVRNRTYDWLSKQLGISRELTHIGYFDIDLCQRTVEICKENQPVTNEAINKTVGHLPRPLYTGELPSVRDTRTVTFLDDWLPKFESKFGNNFYFDSKKFCYTLKIEIGTNDYDIFDFYPKANKVLFRKQNYWYKPGLKWLVDRFMLE